MRALTNACLAVCLMSLISFWKVLSGVILALAENCNDFGHVRFLPPVIDGPHISFNPSFLCLLLVWRVVLVGVTSQ